MRHSFIRKLAAGALAGASIAALAIPVGSEAHAQSARNTSFDIPSQDLASALEAFGRQSGKAIIFDRGQATGKRSGAVRGTLEAGEALRRLLAPTGFSARMANADTYVVQAAPALAGQPTQGEGAAGSAAADAESAEEMEEIVVTGSLIRGTRTPAGSQLIVVDREDIQRGGFGTTPEIIQSLTQNFQGGVNESSRGIANSLNRSGGTAVNLRGLGSRATLTLVNGRRITPGGLRGTFTDISTIPASLIERIEVLLDGASATYGSDAIGGVVNIILRDDFDGAETGLRFGTVTEGEQQEYRGSQTFGRNWSTGNALIAYEYYKRDRLRYEDRPFTASSDLRRFGGSDFRTDFSVPGNILDPRTGQPAFAIPSGQDGTDLDASELLPGQVNLFNQNLRRDLQNEKESHGVFVAASQELGERFEIFAEGRFSDLRYDQRVGGFQVTLTVPRSNPFFVDPFGGLSSIRMRYNVFHDQGEFTRSEGNVRTWNGVAGVKADLWGDWRLQAFGLYSSEHIRSTSPTISRAELNRAAADPNPATAFNPFGDGSYRQNPATIASYMLLASSRVDNRFWSGNIVADGSLISLPGGDVKLALGASYDDFELYALGEAARLNFREEAMLDRRVQAVFGELNLPLFGNSNARPGVERLTVSASLRHEEYDDFGSTTNPKVGILWSPFDGLNVRGTYGTSFRAPDLFELDESGAQKFILFVPDPSSPTGRTLALIRGGNNSELLPETATIWTAGLDWTPPALPALAASLTYYDIRYENRIVRAPDFSILLNEIRFAPAITRNPSAAQIAAVCNDPAQFVDIGFGNCLTAPVGAILDFRLINAGITATDGLDFRLRYAFEDARAGRFNVDLGGTYILSFEEAFGPTAPLVELVDTVGSPIGLQLRNSIGWSSGGFSATGFVNYSDSYTDDRSDPPRKIDSWTTVDLTLAYSTENRLQRLGLDNTRFSMSVHNLFDTDPPFVNDPIGIGFDTENANPRGRFVSFNVIKTW